MQKYEKAVAPSTTEIELTPTPPINQDKLYYITLIMDNMVKKNPNMSNKEWWDNLDSLEAKTIHELKIYYKVYF